MAKSLFGLVGCSGDSAQQSTEHATLMIILHEAYRDKLPIGSLVI
jgi:hypothetical protein